MEKVTSAPGGVFASGVPQDRAPSGGLTDYEISCR